MGEGCDTEPGKYCTFDCEQGNENHQVGAGYFVLERIVSAVKRVEFVGNRMLYIVLRGFWCDTVFLNAYILIDNEMGGACGT
jgi:hypothetical protein